MPWKNAARWVIGIGLGVAFTWFSARDWPVDQLFGGDLRYGEGPSGFGLAMWPADAAAPSWQLDVRYWFGYFVVLSCIHALRMGRWWPLLHRFGPVPHAVLNRIGAVSFMAVFLLPFRLGEVVRPLLFWRDAGIPAGAGVSTVAVERVLDGLVAVGILFAVLALAPQGVALPPELVAGKWGALALFGGACLVLVGMAVVPALTLRVIRTVGGRISTALTEKVVALLLTFIEGLRVLGSPVRFVHYLGMTLVYWACNGFGIWLLGQGFGVEVPLIAAYAMMCAVVVGMMIPNSPGNVGSFWYFMLLPAAVWSVDADAPHVIAWALMTWFMQMGQQTLFGLWGLWARSRATPWRPPQAVREQLGTE